MSLALLRSAVALGESAIYRPRRHRRQLTEPLRQTEMTPAQLNLAGKIIPFLDWFIEVFVRKGVLVSAEIEGTQATLVDMQTRHPWIAKFKLDCKPA